MKQLLFFAILVGSVWSDARPLNWSDLEEGKEYLIALSIDAQPDLGLKVNESLKLREFFQHSAYVMQMIFNRSQCLDNSVDSEMILFNPEPEDTINDKSVGIQLEKNCQVSIFLEPKFYYNKSIFAE